MTSRRPLSIVPSNAVARLCLPRTGADQVGQRESCWVHGCQPRHFTVSAPVRHRSLRVSRDSAALDSARAPLAFRVGFQNGSVDRVTGRLGVGRQDRAKALPFAARAPSVAA